MTDRLKSMRRILKVQDQLKRTADWRLAEAERAVAEVAAARDAVGAFLDRDDIVGGLAVAAVAQLQRLAARHGVAVRSAETEAEAMREATARQKLVAKSVETLAREEASARERKDLERLIEGFAGRTDAGERNEE